MTSIRPRTGDGAERGANHSGAEATRDRALDGYLPTPEAARYLGFQSTSGVRKAVMEGRLRAVGRRGGIGPLLFTRSELDRFARGDPPTALLAQRPGGHSPGEDDGKDNGGDRAPELPCGDEAARRRDRGDRAPPSRRGRTHQGEPRLGVTSENALRRVRQIAAHGDKPGDSKP